MAKREEERRKTAEKNKKEGEAFLAENKKKPGIKTLDVKLPDGTTAEMQYKVITEGTGAIPKSNDTVTVNYRGTLINGKEFDSSAKHGGQPAKFQVNRVVRGWTEALERMKAGSKWELYLPSSLAYGDQGYGPNIEPGATLIFEMELLGMEAPPPPPPPAQPLTSDIIRVPSAEELKKGAKIEVIKPEDLEKLTNAAAQKPEKKYAGTRAQTTRTTPLPFATWPISQALCFCARIHFDDLVGFVCRHDDDHADAHVEDLIQFGFRHAAFGLDEFEDRQHFPGSFADDDVAAFGQHTGDVIHEAAAGDVGEGFDSGAGVPPVP